MNLGGASISRCAFIRRYASMHLGEGAYALKAKDKCVS